MGIAMDHFGLAKDVVLDSSRCQKLEKGSVEGAIATWTVRRRVLIERGGESWKLGFCDGLLKLLGEWSQSEDWYLVTFQISSEGFTALVDARSADVLLSHRYKLWESK